MYQPLAGYKIMDCSRYLPYEYCTLLLADLGAEVLKIEEPIKGDFGRWSDPDNPGQERLSFVMTNRNKKSMTLNLKKKAGKEIFKKIAAEHDVLFETYRPDVMAKLGLSYKTIKKINPKIIYCSGTGYGQTGPYRRRAGHDINYISIAGILSMTGMHTGRPVIPGVPFADMAGGGLFPALVIIAGLLGREKTERGVYIDVSMTDVVASLNIGNLATEIEQKSGESTRRFNILGNSVCYNTYKTKDDKFISMGNVEKKFWTNFCKAIGREELIGKHYTSFEEGEEITELLKKIFASKSQTEWIELMDEVDSCFAPVLTPEQVLEDRHLKKRGMINKIQNPKQGETVQLGFPALFSGGLNYKRLPAPSLGEHTIEILKCLGYSRKEIQRLKGDGVI